MLFGIVIDTYRYWSSNMTSEALSCNTPTRDWDNNTSNLSAPAVSVKNKEDLELLTKADLTTKQENLRILTTLMKDIDGYFLMVVSMSLLNRVLVFAIFMF